MKYAGCIYCQDYAEGQQIGDFGIKICDLENSAIYLFREQSHPGRLIVSAKEHVRDLTEMTPAQRAGFFEDMAKAAEVMHKLFHPDKINFGAYGDLVVHMHYHLVPKYKDQFEWGDVFAMNPRAKYLSPEEYRALIAKIKRELLK